MLEPTGVMPFASLLIGPDVPVCWQAASAINTLIVTQIFPVIRCLLFQKRAFRTTSGPRPFGPTLAENLDYTLYWQRYGRWNRRDRS